MGDQHKVEIECDDNDETCMTFVVRSEDHTMGNALRYVLMKNTDVDFCGYTIPHPSEDVLHIRVQTNGKSAAEVFQKAIQDLRTMFEHIRETFQAEKGPELVDVE